LEVELLLGELEALQRIGGVEFDGHLLQALLDGFGGALAAALRLVGLESLEVGAHGASLRAPLGERRLVLIGHGAGLLLRSHASREPPFAETHKSKVMKSVTRYRAIL
jgi:hypothetical protein